MNKEQTNISACGIQYLHPYPDVNLWRLDIVWRGTGI